MSAWTSVDVLPRASNLDPDLQADVRVRRRFCRIPAASLDVTALGRDEASVVATPAHTNRANRDTFAARRRSRVARAFGWVDERDYREGVDGTAANFTDGSCGSFRCRLWTSPPRDCSTEREYLRCEGGVWERIRGDPYVHRARTPDVSRAKDEYGHWRCRRKRCDEHFARFRCVSQ